MQSLCFLSTSNNLVLRFNLFLLWLSRLRFIGLVFRQEFWNSSARNPSFRTAQKFNLPAASRSGGHAFVEFYKNAVTGDAKDVQFIVRSS